jgi:hypothetical protein
MGWCTGVLNPLEMLFFEEIPEMLDSRGYNPTVALISFLSRHLKDPIFGGATLFLTFFGATFWVSESTSRKLTK